MLLLTLNFSVKYKNSLENKGGGVFFDLLYIRFLVYSIFKQYSNFCFTEFRIRRQPFVLTRSPFVHKKSKITVQHFKKGFNFELNLLFTKNCLYFYQVVTFFLLSSNLISLNSDYKLFLQIFYKKI